MERTSEGSFGNVMIKNGFAHKTFKNTVCETFFREICYPRMISWAERPVNIVYQTNPVIIYRDVGKRILNANVKDKDDAVWQLIRKVSWLHQMGVMHGDLMAQNIMYLDGDVQIIDWGFASMTNIRTCFEHYAAEYRAPDITDDHIPADDIWAVGCVAAKLLYQNSDEVIKDRGTNLTDMWAPILQGMFAPKSVRKFPEMSFPSSWTFTPVPQITLAPCIGTIRAATLQAASVHDKLDHAGPTCSLTINLINMAFARGITDNLLGVGCYIIASMLVDNYPWADYLGDTDTYGFKNHIQEIINVVYKISAALGVDMLYGPIDTQTPGCQQWREYLDPKIEN